MQTGFEETSNPVARALGEIFYMINSLVVVVYEINFIHFVIKAQPSFIVFYDSPSNLYLSKMGYPVLLCVFLLTFNRIGVSSF